MSAISIFTSICTQNPTLFLVRIFQLFLHRFHLRVFFLQDASQIRRMHRFVRRRIHLFFCFFLCIRLCVRACAILYHARALSSLSLSFSLTLSIVRAAKNWFPSLCGENDFDFWDYFSLSFYPKGPSTRNRNRKTTKHGARMRARLLCLTYLYTNSFFYNKRLYNNFLSLSLSLFHSLFHFLSLSFFTFTHKLLFHTNSMSLVVSIFVWFVGRLEIISTDFFPSTGASYLYTY